MKRPLRYCFFSIILILAGCAPKVAPPPAYRGLDLSLEEIVSEVDRDIEALKAVVAINIEKDHEALSSVDASVLAKRPGLVHLRMYRFGMPVGDILIRDDEVFVLSDRGVNRLREFGKEFYYSIFWWEDVAEGVMHRERGEYIIRTEDKVVYLDSETLLPLRQEIRTANRDVYITYNKPKKVDGFWYPSLIKIATGGYKFTVRVQKLFINPPLSENDFRLPYPL